MSSGNEILLYLEKPQFLRLGELIHALNQLQKRDPEDKHELRNHEWVKGCFEYLQKNHMYLVEEDAIRLVVLTYRYRILDDNIW